MEVSYWPGAFVKKHSFAKSHLSSPLRDFQESNPHKLLRCTWMIHGEQVVSNNKIALTSPRLNRNIFFYDSKPVFLQVVHAFYDFWELIISYIKLNIDQYWSTFLIKLIYVQRKLRVQKLLFCSDHKINSSGNLCKASVNVTWQK